jgi:hypothetical protein
MLWERLGHSLSLRKINMDKNIQAYNNKQAASNKAICEVLFKEIDSVLKEDLHRWLKKARDIQWDYKNIVKRKGVLERLK